MLQELLVAHPDRALGDWERLLIARRRFKLGQLGEVGKTLHAMAGAKDGALAPIGDEDRKEDIEARIAATVMVGQVDEAAELLRQCHAMRGSKQPCGTFVVAGHINAFGRGGMARQLLDTFAPHRGTPPASYYQQRAEAEWKSARGGPKVAWAWARAGLKHHSKDKELLAIAAHAAWQLEQWADLVDALVATAAAHPADKDTFLAFAKRTGIAPLQDLPPPPPPPAPAPARGKGNLWWILATIGAALTGAWLLARKKR